MAPSIRRIPWPSSPAGPPQSRALLHLPVRQDPETSSPSRSTGFTGRPLPHGPPGSRALLPLPVRRVGPWQSSPSRSAGFPDRPRPHGPPGSRAVLPIPICRVPGASSPARSAGFTEPSSPSRSVGFTGMAPRRSAGFQGIAPPPVSRVHGHGPPPARQISGHRPPPVRRVPGHCHPRRSAGFPDMARTGPRHHKCDIIRRGRTGPPLSRRPEAGPGRPRGRRGQDPVALALARTPGGCPGRPEPEGSGHPLSRQRTQPRRGNACSRPAAPRPGTGKLCHDQEIEPEGGSRQEPSPEGSAGKPPAGDRARPFRPFRRISPVPAGRPCRCRAGPPQK
jgi:hypothetical protein